MGLSPIHKICWRCCRCSFGLAKRLVNKFYCRDGLLPFVSEKQSAVLAQSGLMKKLLVINGSIAGSKKNCGLVSDLIPKLTNMDVSIVHLSDNPNQNELNDSILKADALLLMTGTYWDSCGSPLQKFLEDFSHLDGNPDIIGKPVGVIVLHHEVGGKSVLSRLQGVLSSMGFLLPPMTGVVLARATFADKDSYWFEDMDVVLSNLEKASEMKVSWSYWPVETDGYDGIWADKRIMQGA